MGFAVKRVLLSCAGEKALPRGSITNGPKTSSKLARNGWQVILYAKPTALRLSP
jgi:hypothetical protein